MKNIDGLVMEITSAFLLLVALTAFVIWFLISMNQIKDECTAKGGVLVKGVEDYVCVERKELR